jgi:hypothetical protein
MRIILLSVTAVSFLVLSPSAAAHIPFKDGPRSAREIAKTLDRLKGFDRVSCRYSAPHVLCTGRGHFSDGDPFRFSVTVHKTAPRKGCARVCIGPPGNPYGICRRMPMTFTS